ncbi:hypothetical protein H8E88_29555 [candidate division KSB1 bacterium]|nr:hypothetical protein [candidate division KSB1 bacterium]
MNQSNNEFPKNIFFTYRIVLFFIAFYFFMMGIALILFPQVLTKSTGQQHAVILGMLRGAGGSILPYSLMYILIAVKPFACRWVAYIIAVANTLAIILDFTSVFFGEYKLSNAMIGVPFEFLSLAAIIIFYSISNRKSILVPQK